MKITYKLDSINNLRDSTLADLNQKLQSIKDKSLGKLKELNLPPKLNTQASAVTNSITSFQISPADLNIPSLPARNNNILGKLNNLAIPAIENVGELESIQDGISSPSESPVSGTLMHRGTHFLFHSPGFT